jgi:release factor glutamine methyltransferase
MISISLSQVKQECTKLLSDNLKISSREISLELNQILLFVLKINNSQLVLKKNNKQSSIRKN